MMIRIAVTFLVATALFFPINEEAAGMDAGGYRGPQASCASRQPPPEPECGIELTCAGRPVRLGSSGGVCFRASCPGVWGILHERTDQASFRRRVFTYRHYTFKGYWELKDQGLIESGPVQQRALFLVLPDDLIEFKLLEPDPCAKIDISELGYVKKGCVGDLQRWLAYRVYMDNAAGSLYRKL
jgi:hypothetical protein